MRRIFGGTEARGCGGARILQAHQSVACRLISCPRTPVPPHLRKILLLVILLLNSQFSIPNSHARSIQTINADKAKEVAREQVVWNGRLCPFSTFALDFLQSVYGKSTYKGLSPEQVVYGWLLRPEVWKDEPMIYIPDADFRRQLNIEGEYAKFSELFDDTLGYKLNALASDLPERMRPLVRETPAVVSLDEKVGDIILLTKGQLFQPRPNDMPPLPLWRVEAEILWNVTPLWAILLSMAAAIAILVILLKKTILQPKCK